MKVSEMRLHRCLLRFMLIANPVLAEQLSEFLPPEIAIKQARDMISAGLKDPYSVKYEGLTARVVPNARREPTQMVCGTVNAKNSYGAYVGAVHFVHFVKLRITYMRDGQSVVADSIVNDFCSRSEFQ